MDKNLAIELITNYKYYTIKDLRFNKEVGYLINKEDLDKFLKLKEELIEDKISCVRVLPLKTFNSKYIYFTLSNYLNSLFQDFESLMDEDLNLNSQPLYIRNIEDILLSRVYSEIEGTLRIENVPTTHKKIKEVCEANNLTDKNDIIIKNMYNTMDYIIQNSPKFNKENLYKIYNLLTKDCLDDEDKLPINQYYRDDVVSVGDFEGAPPEIIDEMMNSLFKFVNELDKDKNKELLFFLPHICHYYLLYVHPYFDYNGRTARMVSFWISYINDIVTMPSFMSEAINERKNEYYQALINTRITKNDLTYFLGYILDTAINFSLIYKNIEFINEEKAKSGDFLNKTEKMYVKKILLHNSKDFFTYKMFNEYINNSLSKQRSITILNDLTAEKLLKKQLNKKGEAIYKFNQDFIKYEIK